MYPRRRYGGGGYRYRGYRRSGGYFRRRYRSFY